MKRKKKRSAVKDFIGFWVTVVVIASAAVMGVGLTQLFYLLGGVR